MLGLLDPTNGTVRTLGLDPREAVAEGRVGAMLQSSGLPVAAHVAEIVEFVRRLYRRSLALSSIVQRAGLGGLERRAIETLSGGELQRLRFGLAIAGDPDLLFLDEPTVGMDVETRRAFWSDMRAYGAQGRTVLFATHYLEEADAIADRVIVLSHGKVIADGTPRSIKERVTTRTVSLTLPDASAADLAAIEAIPTVGAVARLGDRVQITTTDSDTVVKALVGLGLRLSDLEVRGAALEDAFVALTTDDQPAARNELPKGA
jgi:ABC-2 type transport system ATP-binding protein